MTEPKKFFQFGITKIFPCNYLSSQQERLVVVINDEEITNENYERLLSAGFRRSGGQVYRPHCESCKACESIRLNVHDFKPSKSQKRISNINKDLTIELTDTAKPQYFDLYRRYINTIHRGGGMYPANQEQYQNFIFSDRVSQLFVEMYLGEQLVCVAVCDNLPNSLSALYTFYDPDLGKRSLGKYSILNQIDITKKLGKNLLYLGYQIDECAKMNYKKQYSPHQRLQQESWKTLNK